MVDGYNMSWTTDKWHFDRSVQKEVILASYSYRGWKWIYFEDSKRKNSWVDPGAPFTLTTRPNWFGRKTMMCVWWDQKNVVYYELSKPAETVNTKCYQQQFPDLNRYPLEKGQNTEGENTNSYFFMTMPQHQQFRYTSVALGVELIHHLALSEYHLFASMSHAFAEQHCGLYKDVKKWLDEWFAAKAEDCYCVMPER